MRVLEVAPDFPPVVRGGGAQTFYLLADAWVKIGHQVTVLTSCPQDSIKKFLTEAYAFDLRPFSLFNPPKRYGNLAYHMPMGLNNLRSYRKYIKSIEKDFDLIVVHGFMETLPLMMLLTLDKDALRKVVLTNHGLSTAEYSPALHLVSRLVYKYLGKIILSRVSKIVMYSRSVKREFMEFYPSISTDSITLHSLGVDADGFRNSYNEYLKDAPAGTSGIKVTREEAYFLAIGRNAQIKGFDILLRSISLISKDHCHPVLLIAGDRNPYTEQLEKLANELGLGNQVRFLGRISEANKISLMVNCQALVIPSLKEGYGINAIEGRILGIPVIATETGAHVEILKDYLHGTLIPTNNVSALAEAMKKYLSCPKRDRVDLDEEYLSSVDIKLLAKFYLGLA